MSASDTGWILGIGGTELHPNGRFQVRVREGDVRRKSRLRERRHPGPEQCSHN